jgi:hypothetical protein
MPPKGLLRRSSPLGKDAFAVMATLYEIADPT